MRLSPSSLLFALLLPGCTTGAAALFVSSADGGGASLGDAPPSPTLEPWVRQLGSAGVDNGNGVAIDAAGNVYVVGETGDAFEGQTSAGRADAFARSYDASGNERWTVQFGTVGDDVAWGVAASDDAIYVVGETDQALGDTPNAGGRDAFVRCYSAAGVPRWTRQLGNDRDDIARAAAVDAEGNVVVVGSMHGSQLDAETNDAGNAFVRSYDAQGVERWARQFLAFADAEWSVAIDRDGNVVVAGSTYGPDENPDGFVRKLDPAGNELWTRELGTTHVEHATGVSVDASGRVYVVADTDGAFPGATNGGSIDAVVVAYEADGTLRWSRQFGGTTSDSPNGIVAAEDGESFVVGTTGDMPPATSVGEIDPFVTGTSAAGLATTIRLPGTPIWDQGQALAYRDGRLCLAGITLGTYPGQTSAGDFDAFVMCMER